MSYPEDIFADFYEFDTKEEAANWFNVRYKEYKEKDCQIIVHKVQWAVLDNTILEGEFIKGYEVTKGNKKLWVRIFKQITQQ